MNELKSIAPYRDNQQPKTSIEKPAPAIEQAIVLIEGNIEDAHKHLAHLISKISPVCQPLPPEPVEKEEDPLMSVPLAERIMQSVRSLSKINRELRQVLDSVEL